MSDTPRLPRNVKALGVVSLLTDLSSEMIYPLLPLFLTTVLGAGASVIGAIEGAAESTSAFLKLASGWWSDRLPHRKPLVVVGYTLAAVARPLVGVATAAWHVLGIRLTDRAGKGIRSSPRDALLADSTHPSQRGRAYGFHRAADNFGAVIGPLVAWMLLQRQELALRSVFLWAAVPGVVGVIVLLLFVREGPHVHEPKRDEGVLVEAVGDSVIEVAAHPPARAPDGLGAPFWRYLAVLLVFTLGNSADAFLLLRASQLGVAIALIPILWAAMNLVKSLSSTPGGALSDRVGRRPLIVAGWTLYAVVYVLFAFATAEWHVWVLFLLYGAHFGLTEGVEKALVADLVPAARRGTAFGWYNFTIGLGALPASVIFGLVWDRVSPGAAFGLGAALAGVAAVGLLALVPGKRREG
ncbi:MAG TPA: MFS transporter [Gemmatimonadaceae bacterium]|nr:MFS transporter [Gemmatimonadaceae bacterium]